MKINFQFYSQLIATISLVFSIFITTAESLWPNFSSERCGSGKLKYLTGDALADSTSCIGPNGLPYPSSTINRAFGGSSRKGRQSQFQTTLDPIVMQSTLLSAYKDANEDLSLTTRQGLSFLLYNHRD